MFVDACDTSDFKSIEMRSRIFQELTIRRQDSSCPSRIPSPMNEAFSRWTYSLMTAAVSFELLVRAQVRSARCALHVRPRATKVGDCLNGAVCSATATRSPWWLINGSVGLQRAARYHLRPRNSSLWTSLDARLSPFRTLTAERMAQASLDLFVVTCWLMDQVLSNIHCWYIPTSCGTFFDNCANPVLFVAHCSYGVKTIIF